MRLTDAERALLETLDGREMTIPELASELHVTEYDVRETLSTLKNNPDGSSRRFRGIGAIYASWRGMLPTAYRLNQPLGRIKEADSE